MSVLNGEIKKISSLWWCHDVPMGNQRGVSGSDVTSAKWNVKIMNMLC